MSRALLVLAGDRERQKALAWIGKAPVNTRVEFKAPKRSLPQNDRMWAMLTDVASQVMWNGVRLAAPDWKLIFLDALKTELRMVPNIAGNGFVNLGRSSSDLSKAEMGDLMTVIEMFGAVHGVKFGEPEAVVPQAAETADDEPGMNPLVQFNDGQEKAA
jgi:hypothetical protein